MGRTRGGREDATVVAHRHDVPDDDVVLTRWGPATSPRRTAVDLARGVGTGGLDQHARVAWVDALLRVTALTAAEAQHDARRRIRLPGLPVARQVIARARDGVDSVKETELRLLVVDRGFVEPSVQAPVRTAQGLIVALLDLGWEEERLGLEYDGAVHRESRQHSKDLRRHNRIRGRGWTVLQVDKTALAEPDEWLRQLDALGAPRRG
jgi:very-short-patch-repair endonuclease